VGPEIWMLGSSTTSAPLASAYGTSFCFAEFLSNDKNHLPSIINNYRMNFVASSDLTAPRCGVAVAGVCASTDEAAGRLIADDLPLLLKPTIVGSPQTCARLLRTLQAETGVTEFIFLDMCRRYEDRLTSYRLIAEALP
jgi:alkanesulfonate monooxygenase SsuD/methylene tetrahydromethanopterin reductase-like flavin-dependent oxidoreductase (luciferase family)